MFLRCASAPALARKEMNDNNNWVRTIGQKFRLSHKVHGKHKCFGLNEDVSVRQTECQNGNTNKKVKWRSRRKLFNKEKTVRTDKCLTMSGNVFSVKLMSASNDGNTNRILEISFARYFSTSPSSAKLLRFAYLHTIYLLSLRPLLFMDS